MNAILEQFPFIYAELHHPIIEVVDVADEEPVTTSATLPLERKPLNGYESLMRRYAAACEAGR